MKSLPLGCDGAQERVRFLSVPMGTLELSLHNGIQASRLPAPDPPGDPLLLQLLHGKKHSPHRLTGGLVGWEDSWFRYISRQHFTSVDPKCYPGFLSDPASKLGLKSKP